MNVDLLRRRRMELRRSRNELAQALGVTGQAIARLEDGSNHADQPLGVLARLADALAVDLPTLFSPGTTAVSAVATTEACGTDTAVVGSALHAADTPVPVAMLARTLGWDLPRLERALNALGGAATAVGLRLDRSGGLVALVRAAEPLTTEQLVALGRHRVATRGLDATAARLVVECLRRAVTAPMKATSGSGGLLRGNADRVAAGVLGNADLVRADDHGDIELTAGAARALFATAKYRGV
jgi:DNA-binding XRE family transcriptional regulator